VLGVGVNEEAFQQQLYLSQNPVKESFQLINGSGVPVNATIRSMTGRVVASKLPTSERNIHFNTAALASGIYLLTVEAQNGASVHFKLMKQ